MNEQIEKKYARWLRLATDDKDLISELRQLSENEIEDAFYRDLEFGTGGLRGIIGAGINRINIYTITKVSLGLADFVNKTCHNPSIVIGYDSRIKSELFAKTASEVFASKGIKVYIWSRLLPVSLVSYAVRCLGASCGVMITASHNPAKYNGYKVYGSDGCQITTESAECIFEAIKKHDEFEECKIFTFEKALKNGSISFINDEVYEAFIRDVKMQTLDFGKKINKNILIVYSPLNGTGREPVLKVLKDSGFENVKMLKEQEMPDGNFPTCPYPNPEIEEALCPGVEYAKSISADILIATDPDCDRVGIAAKNGKEYIMLTGNEVGVLLLDYICSQRILYSKMPEKPIMIKTIVTSDLGRRVAEKYGVRTIDVLTGFKFIGEQISFLERKDETNSFIFGFEESYGYLCGTYVRDKDGVGAAMLICEMLAFYKMKGITLTQRMNQLYEEFGYCFNSLKSFTFEGLSGFNKMQSVMEKMRKGIDYFGSFKVQKIIDYGKGIDGLPKSNVLKFILPKNSSVTVRPSGTEPKLKVYISVISEDKIKSYTAEAEIMDAVEAFLQ